MKRFAVTGAAGFVGSQLVSYLKGLDHEVVAIVRDPSNSPVEESSGTVVRAADVTDPDSIAAALSGTDGVFHLAALFNDPDKTWDDYRAVNVQGSLNVLEAAQRAGARRVVHCSTVGVATEAQEPPYSEETPYSPQPGDKYEVSKTEGEIAVREFARENGMSLAVVRPAQVYGPGDRSKAKFYKLVKKGVIVRPGGTLKHLIYIDDLCDAFYRAMTMPEADGEVFLIAGPGPTPLDELVRYAAQNLNVRVPPIRLPAKPVLAACSIVEWACNRLGVKPFIFRRSMDFFTKSVACDTRKANELLGFRGRTDVEAGVARKVKWLQAENLI